MKIILSGACKCGYGITTKGELHEFTIDDGQKSWKSYPCPHLVFLCPKCGRLINVS